MAEQKLNEALVNLAQTMSESGKIIGESVIAAQERNLHFMQKMFESGADLLKDHMTESHNFINEMSTPQNRQESFQRLMYKMAEVQDHAMKLAQSTFWHGVEAVKSQSEANYTLADELMKQSEKQLAAFQQVAHESIDAYKALFSPWFQPEKQEASKE